ncbi:hypothetical protein [Gottfriedia luciferensis]|uniref:hypothetical protein n=1 Tax=Gottfriedia luciferensis TaxID=178774 RepID=UPI000B43D1F9|nr:hypothetical protein [Gottfriedia luciferensis]
MKETWGYVLIALSLLTLAIIYSLERLSDSIKQSIAYLKDGGGLSTNNGIPWIVWLLLIIVVGIGIYLINKKK